MKAMCWLLGGMFAVLLIHTGACYVLPFWLAWLLAIPLLALLSTFGNRGQKTGDRLVETLFATVLVPVKVIMGPFALRHSSELMSGSEKAEMLFHGGFFVGVFYVSQMFGDSLMTAFGLAMLCYAFQAEIIVLPQTVAKWKQSLPLHVQEKLERREELVEEPGPIETAHREPADEGIPDMPYVDTLKKWQSRR